MVAPGVFMILIFPSPILQIAIHKPDCNGNLYPFDEQTRNQAINFKRAITMQLKLGESTCSCLHITRNLKFSSKDFELNLVGTINHCNRSQIAPIDLPFTISLHSNLQFIVDESFRDVIISEEDANRKGRSKSCIKLCILNFGQRGKRENQIVRGLPLLQFTSQNVNLGESFYIVLPSFLATVVYAKHMQGPADHAGSAEPRDEQSTISDQQSEECGDGLEGEDVAEDEKGPPILRNRVPNENGVMVGSVKPPAPPPVLSKTPQVSTSADGQHLEEEPDDTLPLDDDAEQERILSRLLSTKKKLNNFIKIIKSDCESVLASSTTQDNNAFSGELKTLKKTAAAFMRSLSAAVELLNLPAKQDEKKGRAGHTKSKTKSSGGQDSSAQPEQR